MIGFRVKGAGRAAALLLLLLVVSGCSKRAQPDKTVRPVAPSMPVGAERWQDGALLLPAKSPVVFRGRLDMVLRAATRLKAWIVAEPEMLGPEGPQIVRTIESGWIAATGYLGVDPLLTRAWTERGVDPHRPLYAGMYPVQRDGARFVNAVETVIREELGIAPGDPIAPSLRMLAAAGGELPEGTNARILRTLAETHPVGGLRVVVAVTSPSEFLTTASSFAEGMGFRAFPRSVTQESQAHVFWSDTGVPALSIRFADRWAVLDLLFPAFVGGAKTAFNPEQDLAALYADLMRATNEIAPGRPHAPAPPGDPAVALSFDQAAVAKLVRQRGYHASLEHLQTTSAERRDAELLRSLITTVSQAQAWSIAADELTGTTYQVYIDELDEARIGSVQMTMFARRGLPVMDTARELPTLKLEQRNSALAIDLQTLRTDPWKQWFAAETAAELGSMQLDAPTAYDLLPIVRSGALAFSSIGTNSGTSALFDELGELVGELDHIERVEVVGLGPTLPDMEERPEVLVAAVLSRNVTNTEIAQTQTSISNVLAGWTGLEADLAAFTPPELGKTTTTFLASEQRATNTPIHHHLVAGDHQVLITGFGVPLEQFDAEVAELAPRKLDAVVQARIGPIALISLLTDDTGELFGDLDPDIVAQRLGALNLRYGATTQGDAQAMTLQLELEAPPKL